MALMSEDKRVFFSGSAIVVNDETAERAEAAADRAEAAASHYFDARAQMVEFVSTSPTLSDGTELRADGLSYLWDNGANVIPDMPNVIPNGTRSLYHFFAAPMTLAGALSLALTNGENRDVVEGEGDFFFDAATVQGRHPFSLRGAGKGVTRFIFRNMGGFAGLDGFSVNVAMDAVRCSTTSISHCSILVDAGFGRDGIKTPCNPGGQGAELYSRVRPCYEFTHLEIGSLNRTSDVSSSLFGVDGWANCVHMGESSSSIVQHIDFVQPFIASIPQANWAGRDQCVAVYLDAGEADAGASAVYHTVVDHLTAHGCGVVVKMRGRVVSPKITNIDAISAGWGIYSGSAFYSPDGRLDSVSEPIIEDSNLPGLFGGIFIQGTDFCQITTVRTSRPSFAGIDYTGPWRGLDVPGGFRQLDVVGFRASASGTSLPTSLRAIAVNGRIPTEDGAPGVFNLKNWYINTQIAAENWQEPLVLVNIREGQIDPPKVRSPGLWGDTALIYHARDVGSITDKITMTGPLPYGFGKAVASGPGASANDIYWPNTNKGFTALSTASSAGSRTISPHDASQYQQQFAAGTGAYDYDYIISNVGAVIGQVITFKLITAATNVRIRFLDENSAGRLLLPPTGSAEVYSVECTWIDLGGVPSMRIKSAVRSFA